jgi:acetyl esterase/lipase
MRRTILSMVVGILVTVRSGQAQTVNLWPGTAPGSERWMQKERVVENTPIGTVVFNVVTPTLTAYLPKRSKATGTGIIIAPGGAFVALTVGLEGYPIARWLQERGIAGFVLKYRIVEKTQEGIPAMNLDTASRYGIADGIQAVKVVRRHAAEWGVSPDRVGFLGFSAGAMVTSGTLLQPDSTTRPDFAALIYGPIRGHAAHSRQAAANFSRLGPGRFGGTRGRREISQCADVSGPQARGPYLRERRPWLRLAQAGQKH